MVLKGALTEKSKTVPQTVIVSFVLITTDIQSTENDDVGHRGTRVYVEID